MTDDQPRLPGAPAQAIVAMSGAGGEPTVLDAAVRSTLLTRSCREHLQHGRRTIERTVEEAAVAADVISTTNGQRYSLPR